MGMAASQARFLQLTARRTNIEYMGQQINQQRVALANQSAGLFEKMLTLDPPVPPSSLDDRYYTQGYTFKDDTKVVNGQDVAVYKGDDMSKKISWSTDFTGLNDFSIDWANANGGGTSGTITFTASDMSAFVQNEPDLGNTAEMDDLLGALGITEQDATARTVLRNVTIEHSIYDPDGNYRIVQENAPAILEFDNRERLINVTLLDDPDTAGADTMGDVAFNDVLGDPNPADSAIDQLGALQASGRAYTDQASSGMAIGQGEELTYSGVFDEVAFTDDMNKYEFQKSAYDYQIERINIETAQIQKQDKSLELKMKQLDTEHRAVQTEMDAVSKVIQKNIESTFKTFA